MLGHFLNLCQVVSSCFKPHQGCQDSLSYLEQIRHFTDMLPLLQAINANLNPNIPLLPVVIPDNQITAEQSQGQYC